MKFKVLMSLIFLTALVLGPYPPCVLAGAAIGVNTTEDEIQLTGGDGDCSLREAIRAANTDSVVDGCAAGSGADIIMLMPGVYTLTVTGASEDAGLTGDLDITSAISFSGLGAENTVIDGGGLDRVIHVTAGGSLALYDLTVRNGKVMDQAANDGGGIYNSGTLNLENVVVSGNLARKSGSSGAPRGGGIYNAGSLTIKASSLLNNSASHTSSFTDAGMGGALYNAPAATATLTNVTISGNDAARAMVDQMNGKGGGIYNDNATLTLQRVTIDNNYAGGASPGASYGGGIYNNNGTLTLTNSTISGNRALGGISFGGGLVAEGATGDVTLTNVTLFGNTAGNRGANTYTFFGANPIKMRNSIVASPSLNFIDNCAGGIANSPITRITDLGNNLEYPAAAVPTEAACGLTIADPKLAALALNAPGKTRTHALQTGSAALDVSCVGAPGIDQRGVSRPQGLSCDLGAYEQEPLPVLDQFVFLPLVSR